MVFHIQFVCQMVSKCFQNRPGSAKLSLRWLSWRLCCLILALLVTILAPIWCILGPSWVPRGIEIDSRRRAFQKSLRASRQGARGKSSKRLADFPRAPIVCKLQCFLHIFQKLASAKVVKKCCQDGAKMVPRWRQDGSKKALLGAILARRGALGLHVGPSVRSLAPSCR